MFNEHNFLCLQRMDLWKCIAKQTYQFVCLRLHILLKKRRLVDASWTTSIIWANHQFYVILAKITCITFFKDKPSYPSIHWNIIGKFCPHWILTQFELKSHWKQLFVLVVTNIVYWRNFESHHWNYYKSHYSRDVTNIPGPPFY